ncbi:large conductance mechanosensitive channel protein [Clostridium sp. CAG:793]|jgi:large conductance mechanosensitive channel protein|nr:large conductance mechanosensitive channel protein [Clostridium sp. CAG:793]
MLKEFKEFALKGNIIDMAIGVIIGGAFQKIVSSLVNDIIMPTLAIFTGKVDFSDLVFTVGNSSIKYGSFITTIVDFLIIAFSIFIAIRTINKLNDKAKENLDKVSHKNKIFKKNKAKDTVEEPTTKVCPFCFSEINIKATRCPHCTSDLTTENSLESEKETIE